MSAFTTRRIGARRPKPATPAKKPMEIAVKVPMKKVLL
jgi:hypothetical protein